MIICHTGTCTSRILKANLCHKFLLSDIPDGRSRDDLDHSGSSEQTGIQVSADVPDGLQPGTLDGPSHDDLDPSGSSEQTGILLPADRAADATESEFNCIPGQKSGGILWFNGRSASAMSADAFLYELIELLQVKIEQILLIFGVGITLSEI